MLPGPEGFKIPDKKYANSGGKKKKIYPEVHKELSLKKYTNTDSTAQTPKWANQFLTK